ncbi:P-aminobenzoate N-oxygenase AurF [Dapis sp. BLCC M126]|uniref:P-aminobenzoate N-oxygenase AurF n=1 Tax=Dapis sp. BLCC M126 TaxID=3400189 RepID=UPI003CEF3E4A
MNNLFGEVKENSLLSDRQTYKKLEVNYRRNCKQDGTEFLDTLANNFCYQDCQDEYWNPEEFSLLYGTPLWLQSTRSQRVILNHLYWVAYYSQIISAEIATIFFNQTSAAGLYAQEDFRLVCDTLDLESNQERAHINAFKTVCERVEASLFGRRIFSYPMRSPFSETIIFADTNLLKSWWKKVQLHCFGLLSSGNTFLACQYFTVRGLRTLNGKIVQHQLSRYSQNYSDKNKVPIPTKISYYHFLDESFHFNSSIIISQDVIKCLPKPTNFEKIVANLGIKGCQQDHYNFSVAINGIFWYDPALYSAIYQVLTSPIFSMSDREAKEMMQACFTEESEGLYRSHKTHQEAIESYKVYIESLDYIWPSNREMSLMSSNSISKYLAIQKKSFAHWKKNHENI